MKNEWINEVMSRKTDYLNDLETLLAIKSVRDDSQSTNEFPLGPGPALALNKMLTIAKRDGFEVKNFDNIVGYVEIGPKESDEYIAVLAHLDVVPAGEGWSFPPFSPVIKDNKIYARGSSDDKGPAMSAYYALKIIKDLNIPLKHRIRLIFGTDEENDWTDMSKYFEIEKQPLLGFSPDAEFPIINGEKGNVQIQIEGGAQNGSEDQLLLFCSGDRTNMVPGFARAEISTLAINTFKMNFDKFIKDNNEISGSYVIEDDIIKILIKGKQVHGSLPETGINAGTYLAKFLTCMDFGRDAKQFIHLLGEKIHQDYFGKNIGTAYQDKIMGNSTVNSGIQKFHDGVSSLINLNFRYPSGSTAEEILENVSQSVGNWNVDVYICGHAQVPHYVSPHDPLVKTLLSVYHEQTNLPIYEQVIGGGTYARLMERGVGFGCLFPDSPDTMHQVDEYARLSDLYKSTSIFIEALIKIDKIH